MKFLKMILLASVIIFSNILTATVSATIFDDYCFDQDMENSFCYETQKACENGRKNDPMAESKCYMAID
ncbi:MAG: hypothetical protein EHM34_03705 [Nitrosopumilales archaeon]|jgi:hypothetical protein|nr:MAG: hypothetical protein EHM34_03705 [Nitrosopumilales archaeon]